MDNLHLLIKQIIQDVERSKNSVHKMRDLLNERRGCNGGSDDDHDQDYYRGLYGHSMVALTALDSALNVLLNSANFSNVEDNNFGNSEPQEDSFQANKDKRGRYKRRRGVEPLIMETTTLSDDGFAWRKYGQKIILHAKHPRNYYRCRHKTDQGCQAIKQVQQISENPKKHRIIYLGNHTCKLNLLKNPQFFLNNPTTPETLDSSSNYLTFGMNKNTPLPKHPLNVLSFSNPSDLLKQEYGQIKEETQYEPSILHNDQYNSSSPDPTTTATPHSEISSGDQFYSSVASPHCTDVEESYYSHMMTDFNDDLESLVAELYDGHLLFDDPATKLGGEY